MYCNWLSFCWLKFDWAWQIFGRVARWCQNLFEMVVWDDLDFLILLIVTNDFCYLAYRIGRQLISLILHLHLWYTFWPTMKRFSSIFFIFILFFCAYVINKFTFLDPHEWRLRPPLLLATKIYRYIVHKKQIIIILNLILRLFVIFFFWISQLVILKDLNNSIPHLHWLTSWTADILTVTECLVKWRTLF